MPLDVDFARLRPWGRGQDTAFEELTCQIIRARAHRSGSTFVRLGTPDGGVEGYATDADGNEHGVQAKFFLEKPTYDQWRDIFRSVKRAVDKHPKLIELTIALPTDRADPRKPGQQWFMDEWNAEVQKWQKYARASIRQVRFSFLGKSEIAAALSLEEHAGRYKWWFDHYLISNKWLVDRLEEVVSQVGPRYNQQLTVDVPVARQLIQFARLPGLLVDLDDLALRADELIPALSAARLEDANVDKLTTSVSALPRPVTGSERVPGPHVTPAFADWHEHWVTVNREAEILLPSYPGPQQGGTQVGRTISALYQLSLRAMRSMSRYAPAYSASALLLWGDAGAGKTHILCDTATLRQKH